jgi:hypothetical protein
MQAFARAAGAEGDLDSKGRPTDALGLRVRNAFLAALIGEGPDSRALIRTLIERSGELGMRTMLNALIDRGGTVLALADVKPALSIVPHLRRAVRSYVAWRTDGQAETLDAFIAQPDLIQGQVPPETDIIMRLMEAGRLSPALARYADLARAVDTATPDMFGRETAPIDLLRQAQADTASEPAATDQPAPATPSASEASPRPVPPPPRPGPLPTPPAPTFTPQPYSTTTLDTPPSSTAPTWTLLGSGLKAIDTADADGLADEWSWIIPNFQGGKGPLADRATAAIRRRLGPAERDRIRHVVDLFGGGGAWGLFHALQNFPSAQRLTVNGNVIANNLVITGNLSVNQLANGTSNVTVAQDSNITFAVAGVANVMTVTDSTVLANSFTSNNFILGDATTTACRTFWHKTITADTTPNQVLLEIPAVGQSSIDFKVIAADVPDQNRQSSMITTVTYGTSTSYSEYARSVINTVISDLSVDQTGGNIRLLASPRVPYLIRYTVIVSIY